MLCRLVQSCSLQVGCRMTFYRWGCRVRCCRGRCAVTLWTTDDFLCQKLSQGSHIVVTWVVKDRQKLSLRLRVIESCHLGH